MSKPKVLSPAGAGETLQSIHDDYNRQLLQLERQRLERLGQACRRASHPRRPPRPTRCFSAWPSPTTCSARPSRPPSRSLKSPGSSPPVVFLAQTIDIIASADMGRLRRVAGRAAPADRCASNSPSRPAQAAAARLDTPASPGDLRSLLPAAASGRPVRHRREAFQLVAQRSENPAVKGFCASRLNQLDMIGKPAPAIQGTDLDGKPVDLADLKGNVVLVVFWASWCLPSSAEVAWLDQVYTTYQARGFRIVGINLDTLQNDGPKLETVMPNIRRFLLDHNVRWPNLINGTGAHDYARPTASPRSRPTS